MMMTLVLKWIINNTCHTVTSSTNLTLLRLDRLTMYTSVKFCLTLSWHTFSAQTEHGI